MESELKLEWSTVKEVEQIFQEIIDFNKIIVERNQYFKEKIYLFDIDEKILSKFDIQYPDLLLNYIADLIESKKKKFYDRYGTENNPIKGTYKHLKMRLVEIQKEMNTHNEKEKYFLDI